MEGANLPDLEDNILFRSIDFLPEYSINLVDLKKTKSQIRDFDEQQNYLQIKKLVQRYYLAKFQTKLMQEV